MLNPDEGRDHPGGSIVSSERDELAAAGVFAGHRAVLCAREQQPLDQLSDRRRSARVDGPRRQPERRRRGAGRSITAIDPKTAKIAWRHALPGGGGATGMLTTAGRLVFAGDGAGNLVAFDAANGNAAVALPDRHRLECAADLHAGRAAIPARRRRRHAGRIRSQRHAVGGCCKTHLGEGQMQMVKCANGRCEDARYFCHLPSAHLPVYGTDSFSGPAPIKAGLLSKRGDD